MIKFLSLFGVIILMMTLTACGEPVSVPPAMVGKVLTNKGLQPQLIMPSRFRLDPCWSLCDKLILVEASDVPVVEQMEVMMPKDQLVLTFDVAATVSLLPDNSHAVFERLTGVSVQGVSSTMIISMQRIYETYAKQRIRTVARSVMTSYSINQVNENRDAIERELFQTIQAELANSPVQVKQLGLSDVNFPSIIVDAKIAAEKRKIDIETEEANRAVMLAKKRGELEEANADQAIRLKVAETIRLENEKVAASVDPKYLAYRQLEVMETLAKNQNTVFFPVEMLANTKFTGSIANSMFINHAK